MPSLDAITLGVPDLSAARAFYGGALAPSADIEDGATVRLKLHGAGELALTELGPLAVDAGVADHASSGFRGFVVSYILDQPSEVEATTAAAEQQGAMVLKEPKKGFFGGFSATFQTPDGAIWKTSSEHKKDKAQPQSPPHPSETAALLGVEDPKASKAFYGALGFTVDRDYGSKYIDFEPAPGGCRLGLLRRDTLAKDAGADEEGSGFRALVLEHRAGSREAVDALLAAAVEAGGSLAGPTHGASADTYAGHFADPDGHLWKVTAE